MFNILSHLDGFLYKLFFEKKKLGRKQFFSLFLKRVGNWQSELDSHISISHTSQSFDDKSWTNVILKVTVVNISLEFLKMFISPKFYSLFSIIQGVSTIQDVLQDCLFCLNWTNLKIIWILLIIVWIVKYRS